AHPRRRLGGIVVEPRDHAGEALRRRLRGLGSDQAYDRAVLALDQPREQLHAEEARRAGEEDRLAHRIGAPIAWKPPSTCRISPVIPRARSLSRKQTAAATGEASRVSQPSGAPARQSWAR